MGPTASGQAGFDGVHVDAETVWDGDGHFLRLLEELRQEFPDRTLSVAASHWMPDAIGALPLIGDLRWTGDYYREIAARVDQIATMTYDSYTPFPSVYRLWMREQARGISRSLAQSETEVLIGISVSDEATLSHRVEVENLPNGLAAGVAIYTDWDFSSSDAQAWQQWQE